MTVLYASVPLAAGEQGNDGGVPHRQAPASGSATVEDAAAGSGSGDEVALFRDA
jgi:hypothetical protein